MSRVKRKHILLEKAISYSIHDTQQAPSGFHYDWEAGAWLDDESDQFYAFSKRRRPPESKKSDVETGEDQKGE